MIIPIMLCRYIRLSVINTTLYCYTVLRFCSNVRDAYYNTCVRYNNIILDIVMLLIPTYSNI